MCLLAVTCTPHASVRGSPPFPMHPLPPPSPTQAHMIYFHGAELQVGSGKDHLTVVPSGASCYTPNAAAVPGGVRLADIAVWSPSQTAATDLTVTAAAIEMPAPGLYRCCYFWTPSPIPTLLSRVLVVRGTPAYAVHPPAAPTWTPLALEFAGYGLDTRPGRDRAKLTHGPDCTAPPATDAVVPGEAAEVLSSRGR